MVSFNLRQISKIFSRNKKLKPILYGSILLVILYNFYSSIYGISLHNDKLKQEIIKIPESKTSSSIEIFHQDVSKINRLPNNASIREQLHFQFPYDATESIPKIIWQTWKTSRTDENFQKKFYKFTQQWIDKNPKYIYNMLPDSAAHELINHLYGPIPKVLRAYNLLPKSILKADFFRYLILFARGGVYSDIDTVSLKSIDDWTSYNQTIYDGPNNAGLVIGIEADPDRPDWNQYYAKRVQFCQWTIQSKKGHPLLGEIISRITEITLEKESNGFLRKTQGKDAGDDIMNWTGPGIFTDEIFKYFNEVLNFNNKAKIINKTDKNEYNKGLNIYKDGVDWKFFTLMDEPVVFDDVLILPITSFSPGVGHMGSKSISNPIAFVRHMFEGSWKPENERHIGENQETNNGKGKNKYAKPKVH